MLIALALAVGVLLSEEEFRARVLAALKASVDKMEAAAIDLGISPSRFSKQCNGHDRLTFLADSWRLEDFWPALLEQMADAHGMLVVKNEHLKELIATVELRMVKAELPVERQVKVG